MPGDLKKRNCIYMCVCVCVCVCVCMCVCVCVIPISIGIHKGAYECKGFGLQPHLSTPRKMKVGGLISSFLGIGLRCICSQSSYDSSISTTGIF